VEVSVEGEAAFGVDGFVLVAVLVDGREGELAGGEEGVGGCAGMGVVVGKREMKGLGISGLGLGV
jgi:hypothetical protein